MRTLKFKVLIAALVMGGSLAFIACSDDAQEPVPVDFEFGETLSSMGFFTGDLYDLQPASRVFLYDLSTPLFSDYTIKHRYIWLPEGSSIEYKAQGIVGFPAGTVIIKNFSSLNADDSERRLETRLLFLDPDDGEWKVMVYLWNDEQTEAYRHITGKTINIRVRNDAGDVLETAYRVPNTNDCKRCHSSNDDIIPIGPRVRSLNTVIPGASQNQLDTWAAMGYLSGLPATGVPVLPDWADESAFSMDERARAYLDMNCAHCHTAGGDAFNTGLFLEYEQTDSTRLGVYKIPVSAGPGSGHLTYDIVPGDADASIMHFRMNNPAPGVAMPELAKSLVHEEGVALIRAWINSL